MKLTKEQLTFNSSLHQMKIGRGLAIVNQFLANSDLTEVQCTQVKVNLLDYIALSAKEKDLTQLGRKVKLLKYYYYHRLLVVVEDIDKEYIEKANKAYKEIVG